MRITKYEHACFILEEQEQKLIIDPGEYTNLPQDLTNIAVLIISHKHPDHFNEDNIRKIREANPNVRIFATEDIAAVIPGSQTPHLGQVYETGVYWLKFYGGQHEAGRASMDPLANLGVLINNNVAYPGDSYAEAGEPANILLAPMNAPWLRVKEAYEFVANTRAKLVIPTHDFLLSEAGHDVYGAHFEDAAHAAGGEYRHMKPGEFIEIKY